MIDEDDLFQKGWLLLEQARDNFEDIEGYDFTVYAWSFIQTRLIDYIRKEENTKDWERFHYEEGMRPERFNEERIRDGIRLEGAELDNRNQRIIKLIGEGYTQQEIGNKLDISQQAISKRIKKIKSKVVESRGNFVY